MGVARCSQSVAGPYVARVSGQSRGVAVARSFLGYGYGYTWWPGYTYGYAWRRSPACNESGAAGNGLTGLTGLTELEAHSRRGCVQFT